jgi:DNA-binding XRE family transcriptional regulator
MLHTFGYDSKAVIPALQEVGITSSKDWMNKCTRLIREELTAKRDHKVAEMHEAGATQQEIAEVLGTTQPTVGAIIKRLKKADEYKNDDSIQTYIPQACPFDDESASLSPEFTGFEEEEDEAPIVNPAEAQQRKKTP